MAMARPGGFWRLLGLSRPEPGYPPPVLPEQPTALRRPPQVLPDEVEDPRVRDVALQAVQQQPVPDRVVLRDGA